MVTAPTAIRPRLPQEGLSLPGGTAGDAMHRPVRPAWTCAADGEPWPCPGARLHLRSEYAGDPVGLASCMSSLLLAAAVDVAAGPTLSPELFNRFMAWTDSPNR